MSILETILVFAAIPLVIYGICSAVTLRSKFAGRPRYRPGQEWNYPPMWWTGDRAADGDSHHGGEPVEAGASAVSSSVKGGARGNW